MREAKGEERKSCRIWRSQVWRKAPERLGGAGFAEERGATHSPRNPQVQLQPPCEPQLVGHQKGFRLVLQSGGEKACLCSLHTSGLSYYRKTLLFYFTVLFLFLKLCNIILNRQ